MVVPAVEEGWSAFGWTPHLLLWGEGAWQAHRWLLQKVTRSGHAPLLISAQISLIQDASEPLSPLLDRIFIMFLNLCQFQCGWFNFTQKKREQQSWFPWINTGLCATCAWLHQLWALKVSSPSRQDINLLSMKKAHYLLLSCFFSKKLPDQ